MRFSEIASRLTGISTPIFGVSWTPAQSDVEAVRRTLVFLEDRRVLYAPDEVEVPRHCVESALRIREFLTDQLGLGRVSNDVAGSLRAMRAAARKFLDATDLEQLDREAGWSGQILGAAGWRFNQALGEMRGVFGIHVARLAVAYGLDVDEPLASVLPLDPDADEDDCKTPVTGEQRDVAARGDATVNTAARIFISYRRSDASGWARQLHDNLSTRFGAERVFRDVAIEPGVDYIDHIERVMDACEVCIVVIGPRWADAASADGRRRLEDPDDLVSLEIQWALSRSDVHVIPALVEGAKMPAEHELPIALRPLTRRTACELSDARWDYDVYVLDRRLRQVLVESTVGHNRVVLGDPARKRERPP
ncbi:MAG: hypothetical protein QOI98_3268 [Solirubrobacteraceae bacterium]|jgi:hypothetical protein|nr:hypothetical protein [Solirubrobacteraceae bacterium]